MRSWILCLSFLLFPLPTSTKAVKAPCDHDSIPEVGSRVNSVLTDCPNPQQQNGDERLHGMNDASESDIGIDQDTLSRRSPARNAPKGSDIVQSGRKFGFTTHQGAIILEGAGEMLQDDQMDAEERNYKAQLKVDDLENHVERGIWDLRTAFTKKHQDHLYRKIDRSHDARMRHVHDLTDAQQDMRETGKAIERIGLVNKNMRKRMDRKFKAIPNNAKDEQKQAFFQQRKQAVERAKKAAARKATLAQKKTLGGRPRAGNMIKRAVKAKGSPQST